MYHGNTMVSLLWYYHGTFMLAASSRPALNQHWVPELGQPQCHVYLKCIGGSNATKVLSFSVEEVLNLKILSEFGGIRPRVPWRTSPTLYGLSHQPSRRQRCEKSTAFGGTDFCVYQPVNVSCIPLSSSSICD